MLSIAFFYIYMDCSTQDITERKVRSAFAFHIFGSVLPNEMLKVQSCYKETHNYICL